MLESTLYMCFLSFHVERLKVLDFNPFQRKLEAFSSFFLSCLIACVLCICVYDYAYYTLKMWQTVTKLIMYYDILGCVGG